MYANPENPFVCSYVSLGIYLCLNANRYEETEHIFRKSDDEKDRVASTGYCAQLKEMMMRNWETVKNYVRLAHANAHGF